MLEISSMKFEDISKAVVAFKEIGWTKESSLFVKYLAEEENGLRKCWIAKYNGDFAGYITLVYKTNYKYFVENNIPEIVDLNVLPHFRRQGIGQILLNTAELEAFKYSNTVGIGVGLYGGEDGGYGNAQRLYVKNGYIPDGHGITYNELIAVPGRSYPIDDELILWMIKKLG